MKYCTCCKLNGDDESFYPNAPQKAWCRNCINNRRRGIVEVAARKAEKRAREQSPIRSVVKYYQSNGLSLVYLIEGRTPSPCYKIGFSTNVDQRITTLNTAHSSPLELIAVAPGGRPLEKTLHQQFFRFHINHEWFAKRVEILEAFKGLPSVMVFLPGYMTAEPPQLDVSSV